MRAPPAALALLGLGFAVFLFWKGTAFDASPYAQPVLWRLVHVASLGGATLGALAAARHWLRTPGQRLAMLPLGLFVWRIVYFPVMVFSGHVASLVEWTLIALGLPVAVFGPFAVTIATLHGAVGFASAQLLRPVHRLVRYAVPVGFAVACAVSFTNGKDLRASPDRVRVLEGAIPAPVAPHRNPYLPRLTAPGYRPHQRVMLLAAGLTYETIPPSPWARTVMSVLEALFDENPHGSTADRVLEHYRAYASAHPLIGCRSFETCPVAVAPAPAQEAAP